MSETQQQVAVFKDARLPWHPAIEQRFGVDKSSWKALVEAIFPSAKSADAVVLALSYCKARNLDPFKRPVHIVPVWSTAANGYVESCWPGINELRTTAHRTSSYAGIDETIFGDEVTRTFKGKVKSGKEWESKEIELTYPSWARVTVYRVVAGVRVAFVGPRIDWLSMYSRAGGKNNELPNDRWAKDPRYMLEKCAEAAALRRAFPEELGNEYVAEEMDGKVVDHIPGESVKVDVPQKPTRDAKAPTEQQAARGHAEMDRAAAAAAERVVDHDPETGEVKEDEAKDAESTTWSERAIPADRSNGPERAQASERTAETARASSQESTKKDERPADPDHKFKAIVDKEGEKDFEDAGQWQAALLKCVNDFIKTVDGLEKFRASNAPYLAAASAAGWGNQAAFVSDAISAKIERLKKK